MEKDAKTRLTTRQSSRPVTSKFSALPDKDIYNLGSSSKLAAKAATLETPSSSHKCVLPPSGPSSSSSTRSHASLSALDEVKRIYEHFHALGMPREITTEVFERLFNSGSEGESEKLKDTLRLLAERLVGRQEALRARGLIARQREGQTISKFPRPTSKLKAPAVVVPKQRSSGKDNNPEPTTLLEDPMKVALARREAAYRGLTSVTKEYEGLKSEMQALDAQKKQFERKLEERRRALLLISVLEKREAVRLSRLGAAEGMGKLVWDLRKRVDKAMKNFVDVISNSGSFEIPRPISTQEIIQRAALERRKEEAFKYKHISGALANLHAHHIRCLRTDGASVLTSNEDVEKRLEKVLSRLWPSDDTKGMEKMKTKLTDVARRRAEKKTRFQGNGVQRTKVDLNEIQQRIEKKEKRVQEKINRALALGWLCEEYIDLISTFRSETAKALSTILEDERKRVHGYVDVLLARILSQSHTPSSSTKSVSGELQLKAFEEEVRDIMGNNRVAIWEDVKALVERVVESEDMMRSIKPVEVQMQREQDGLEMDLNFEKVLNTSTERSRKLLERKGKKAEYGFEVAKEIRALLDGCRKLK